MSNVKKGFDFSLIIHDIEKVTPRSSGESEIDGNDVEWGYAVKFETIIVDLVDDKDFVKKEVETRLSIEIPCTSKSEVTNLNDFLLKLKYDPQSFKCEIKLPTFRNKIYSAKTILQGKDFIELFEPIEVTE